jgi:hypothetical protein
MLYLHCGWPRTSTSCLQAALYEHADHLASMGIVYPDRWTVRKGGTHHGLAQLISASQCSPVAFNEFRAFLVSNADQDVLLSAEALTGWLRPRERLTALLHLIRTAREVGLVRCIWTLRRYDEFLASLYLRNMTSAVINAKLSPAEFFVKPRQLDDLFNGMQHVENAVGGEVTYVKYASDGAHHGELLHTLGVPTDLRVEIEWSLKRMPRLNPSPSQKQAIVELHFDSLSARAGIELNRAAVRDLFYRGTFNFEGDQPCELVDDEAKRIVHRRALAAANRTSFSPYVKFFGAAEITRSSPVSLDPYLVTDDDLRRLSGHLSSKLAGFGLDATSG